MNVPKTPHTHMLALSLLRIHDDKLSMRDLKQLLAKEGLHKSWRSIQRFCCTLEKNNLAVVFHMRPNGEERKFKDKELCTTTEGVNVFNNVLAWYDHLQREA
jgi:hypothetical protein